MEKIALLIDAENISANYAEKIFSTLKARGEVIVRRAYADWTKAIQKPQKRADDSFYDLWEVLYSWYSVLADNGITPMLQPQNTYGKNSSDILLVIDAMDLLHEGICDTFCIVSSDGDFTRLATRLLAGGKHVIIMGEGQTPRSVRNVAEFILLNDKTSTTGGSLNSRSQRTPVRKKPTVQPIKVEIAKAKEVAIVASEVKEKPKTVVAKTAEKQQVNTNVPVVKAKEYDNAIINSIIEILAVEKDGETTYQRLLNKLRRLHPECDVIKVGESPIELFKNLPQLKHRRDGATYYFSVNTEVKSVPPSDSVKKDQSAEQKSASTIFGEIAAVAEKKTEGDTIDLAKSDGIAVEAEKPAPKKKTKRATQSKESVATKESSKKPVILKQENKEGGEMPLKQSEPITEASEVKEVIKEDETNEKATPKKRSRRSGKQKTANTAESVSESTDVEKI